MKDISTASLRNKEEHRERKKSKINIGHTTNGVEVDIRSKGQRHDSGRLEGGAG